MSNANSNVWPAATGRVLLKGLLVSEDGQICRVRALDHDFEFDVPRILPIFLPSFHGESVELREGVTISCEFVPGTHDEITSVLIEDDMVFERKGFKGAQPEVSGWTPYFSKPKDAGKE
jgi:hypothetical protein